MNSPISSSSSPSVQFNVDIQRRWLRNFHQKIKNVSQNSFLQPQQFDTQPRFFSLEEKELDLFKQLSNEFYRRVVDEILTCPLSTSSPSPCFRANKRKHTSDSIENDDEDCNGEDDDFLLLYCPIVEEESAQQQQQHHHHHHDQETSYINFAWICKILFDFASIAAIHNNNSTTITIISKRSSASFSSSSSTLLDSNEILTCFFYELFLMLLSLLTLFSSREHDEADHNFDRGDDQQVEIPKDIYKRHHPLVGGALRTLNAIAFWLITPSPNKSDNVHAINIIDKNLDLVVIDWCMSFLVREVARMALMNSSPSPCRASITTSNAESINFLELKLCNLLLASLSLNGTVFHQRILVNGLMTMLDMTAKFDSTEDADEKGQEEEEHENKAALLGKFTATCTHFLEVLAALVENSSEPSLLSEQRKLADSISLIMELLVQLSPSNENSSNVGADHGHDDRDTQQQQRQQQQAFQILPNHPRRQGGKRQQQSDAYPLLRYSSNSTSSSSSTSTSTSPQQSPQMQQRVNDDQLLLAQITSTLMSSPTVTQSQNQRQQHQQHRQPFESQFSPASSLSAESLVRNAFRDALSLLPGDDRLDDGLGSKLERHLVDPDIYHRPSIRHCDVKSTFARLHQQTESILNDLAYQANTEKVRNETLEKMLERLVRNQLKEVYSARDGGDGGGKGAFPSLFSSLSSSAPSASTNLSPSSRRAWEEFAEHRHQVRTALTDREHVLTSIPPSSSSSPVARSEITSSLSHKHQNFVGETEEPDEDYSPPIRRHHHHHRPHEQQQHQHQHQQQHQHQRRQYDRHLYPFQTRSNNGGGSTRAPTTVSSTSASSLAMVSDDDSATTRSTSNLSQAKISLLETQLRDMQEKFLQEREQWQRHSAEQQKQIQEILNQRSQEHFGLSHLKF